MGYYSAPDGVHCVNLHTGEELWAKKDITLSMAIAENYLVRAQGPPVDSYNAYLMQLGSTLRKWDAYTGELIVEVPGMSGTYDPTPYDAGDWGVRTYVYSTQTVSGQRYLIKWTPQGRSDNFTSRIIYNVTYPLNGITGITGKYGFYYGVSPSAITRPSGAFDIETGQILWMKNYTINEAMFSSGGVLTQDGVYVYPKYYGDPNQQGLRPLMGIDVSNGNILFDSTVTTYPGGSFWSYSQRRIQRSRIPNTLRLSAILLFNSICRRNGLCWQRRTQRTITILPRKENVGSKCNDRRNNLEHKLLVTWL
jgi:hypothetical protein